MNYESETHVNTSRSTITSGKRFYDLPKKSVKILDVRVKDHDNTNGAYRSIPRATFEPQIEDEDGV